MSSRNSLARRVALCGLMVALAFILSYVERMIPINIGIPGVKLGLANLVVLLALCTLSPKEAFLIAVIRIILSGLTFSGLFSMLYALAGGLLSYLVMLILIKKDLLGMTGVSICGGISHNIGQLLVAMCVLETGNVWYYFPVLLISGAVSGTLIGILGGLMAGRLQTFLKRN